MFPKTMGTILKERLSAQTRDTETEYCTVAKLRNITPDVIPPDTLRNIERITKGLSVRLQGLMQSLFPSAPYPSTRGRLNTAKLFRIKTGNPKVFIQKTEAVAINTSLHILLDASASMYGKRMELGDGILPRHRIALFRHQRAEYHHNSLQRKPQRGCVFGLSAP